jgi:predicted dehydrogenase
MRKLKVGHVGGRSGYGTLFQAHPRTELVALCDRNREALEETRQALGLKRSQCFQDFTAFLNSDLDIVVIGTPIPVHVEQSILAMESGMHVLCEVTAADSIEDCKKLVQAVKRTGMQYMLAENMCYVQFIREWKEMIQEGQLGKIFYAESEYIHPIRARLQDPNTGRLRWRAHRPPIHYCSHSLGPLLMLLDDRVVKATAAGKEARIMPDVGVGAIDMQVALFETAKSATIKLLRTQVAAKEPPHHSYELYGTKGYVENTWSGFHVSKGLLYVEDVDSAAKEIEWPIKDANAPEAALQGGHGTSEYYLIQDFINAIDNDTTPPIDVVTGINMTLPGLIAHEAAMAGNVWLDVPQIE